MSVRLSWRFNPCVRSALPSALFSARVSSRALPCYNSFRLHCLLDCFFLVDHLRITLFDTTRVNSRVPPWPHLHCLQHSLLEPRVICVFLSALTRAFPRYYIMYFSLPFLRRVLADHPGNLSFRCNARFPPLPTALALGSLFDFLRDSSWVPKASLPRAPYSRVSSLTTLV